MSTELKTALVNEALEISNLFNQNCALKHGPTQPTKQKINSLPEEPKPEPPQVHITNNIPAAPAATNTSSPAGVGAADTVKQSLLKTAAPYLLSAAIGSGVAAPVMWWLNQDSEQVATETPTLQSQASLLQYLEDNMQHLPADSEAE